MVKPKIVNLTNKSTQNSNNLDEEGPQFRQNRVPETDENSSFLSKFNSKLNDLGKFQFLMLLISLLAFSFFTFRKIQSNDQGSFVNLLPDIVASGPDCEEDVVNPLCWPGKIVPSVKKTNDFTNALIVGVDQRDSDPSLMNTDTIIVASYDHSTGKTLLISFPRDLYLPYQVAGQSTGFSAKINALYSIGEGNNKVDGGLELLAENIENWLDLKIHYTAKVNFNTLIDVIDSLGGISIDLEESYTDVFPYADLPENFQQKCIRAVDLPAYCVFSYPDGLNEFDGQEALIYSRMRQYTSDFDRARRQQEVIDAIKAKVLGDDGNILDKAKFGWEIYQSVLDDSNVQSNIEYNDLIGAALLANDADLRPINVVLDPNFGSDKDLIFETSIGSSEATEDSEAVPGIYVIQPFGRTFERVRDEIDEIRKFPDLYRDEGSVVIVNKTGENFAPDHDAKKLETQDPYFDFLVLQSGTQELGIQPMKIFVFNDEKHDTVEYLKEFFDTENVEYIGFDSTEERTRYKEDIKVVFYDIG